MRYKRNNKKKHRKYRRLVIAGTCQECDAIINRLCAENPNTTIAEYLDKYHKDILILR